MLAARQAELLPQQGQLLKSGETKSSIEVSVIVHVNNMKKMLRKQVHHPRETAVSVVSDSGEEDATPGNQELFLGITIALANTNDNLYFTMDL